VKNICFRIIIFIGLADHAWMKEMKQEKRDREKNSGVFSLERLPSTLVMVVFLHIETMISQRKKKRRQVKRDRLIKRKESREILYEYSTTNLQLLHTPQKQTALRLAATVVTL
jgi:hypothetical protein